MTVVIISNPQGDVHDSITFPPTFLRQTILTATTHFRWVNPKADEVINSGGKHVRSSCTAPCLLRPWANLIQEDAVQNYIYLFQDGYGFSSDLDRLYRQHLGQYDVGCAELEI